MDQELIKRRRFSGNLEKGKDKELLKATLVLSTVRGKPTNRSGTT
jgi:hypothetical protein